MGDSAQTRLVRKLDLERFLGQIKSHPSPKVSLEQYTTSETAAATMLYLAAYNYGDIVGKRVLDLGCGTGRLALGAAFLGAKVVVGVDIDKTAVLSAIGNAFNVGMQGRVQWVNGDINTIQGRFDTVVQNPPFGVQRRAADRKFLEKALEVGRAIYSFHNHPTFNKQLMARLGASARLLQVDPDAFLKQFIESHNGRIEAVYALPLVIPKMFSFHTKARQEIAVDLYVIKAEIRNGN
jgi:putative methylase